MEVNRTRMGAERELSESCALPAPASGMGSVGRGCGRAVVAWSSVRLVRTLAPPLASRVWITAQPAAVAGTGPAKRYSRGGSCGPPPGRSRHCRRSPVSPNGPSVFWARLASWLGLPNSRWPRPLQAHRQPPRIGRGPTCCFARRSSSTRSSFAAAASRHWNWRTGRAGVWRDGQRAGVRVAAEQVATRKSPRLKLLLVLVDDESDHEVAWPGVAGPGQTVESLDQHLVGGLVADLLDHVPSTLVMVQGSPIGVQPWETTVSSVRSPPKARATAPSSKTSPLR